MSIFEMTCWKRVSEDRYMDMLEILPPRLVRWYGFLVGEPVSERHCMMTGHLAQTYTALVWHGGAEYLECLQPLTADEFDALTREIVERGRLVLADDPKQMTDEQLQAAINEARQRPELSATAAEIAEAQERYASDRLEIDEEALVSRADDHSWVAAWVMIESQDELAAMEAEGEG